MGVFANNIILRGGETPPPVKHEKIVQKSFKDIHEETKTEVVEEKPKYSEVHDGELKKMINNKSSYLTDMIGLKD